MGEKTRRSAGKEGKTRVRVDLSLTREGGFKEKRKQSNGHRFRGKRGRERGKGKKRGYAFPCGHLFFKSGSHLSILAPTGGTEAELRGGEEKRRPRGGKKRREPLSRTPL